MAVTTAKTATRVEQNTADEINERIRCQTEANIARCAFAGPDAITRRLAELDKEWDIERYVETVAPALSLFGLALGTTIRRRWLMLPIVVQGFFMQHALQGWCPPVPILRRLGVRTMEEINEERYALKALRGDFEGLPSETSTNRLRDVIQAVRR